MSSHSVRVRGSALLSVLLALTGCDCRSSDEDREVGPPELRCAYPASLSSEVQQALDSGDALRIPSADAAIDAALAQLEADRIRFDPDLRTLFGLAVDGSTAGDGSSLTAIDWDPRHDTQLLGAIPGTSAVAIATTEDDAAQPVEPRGLAVIARIGATRTMAFGTNPFRVDPSRGNSSVVDDEMDRFLVNALGWLTDRPAGTALNVVIAHLDESHWFADESSTRAFLTARLPGSTVNAADACDGPALEGCLAAGADLLVVSGEFDDAVESAEAITARVAAAIAAGIPVLYLGLDGGPNALGRGILEAVGARYLGDNYWSNERTVAFDGRITLGRVDPALAPIQVALEHLRSRSYGFTIGAIAADPDANPDYVREFAEGASVVRERLVAYDEDGEDLFGSCGRDFDKLLVLVGDRLRQEVEFPMATASTSTDVFLRSYFADHALLGRRYVAPAQPDRGSFDSRDLSAVQGETRTVELTSHEDFRAAGVYLLPGRMATIERLDDSEVEVTVFVNTQRSSSTHEFEDGNYGGYSRPKFLRSAGIPLVAGRPIAFVNPYGGPLQLGFGENGQPVRVRFSNVGRHAYWRSPADDAHFAATLAAGTYDWAEVVSDHFEVHSTTEKMRESLSNPRWSTAAILAAGLERYSWNYAHVVSGHQGEGIDDEPEVVDWADARGIVRPTMAVIKHGNMDQPTCGYGCSGNPYDAGWAVDPVGHGHLHELGHSLQHGRFQIAIGGEQFGNHSVTNWTPFYGAARSFEEEGIGGDWGIPHEPLFGELQAAYAAGDRAGDFSTQMESYLAGVIANDGITQNYAILLQAMAAARHAGVITNGYHLIPRMHDLEWAVDAARVDDATWLARREVLGFGGYARAAIPAMTNADFFAIALCEAAGLDYRDFFAMWGVTLTTEAKAQIGARNYPVVPRAFYAFDENTHTHGGVISAAASVPRIVLDGTTAWPLP